MTSRVKALNIVFLYFGASFRKETNDSHVEKYCGAFLTSKLTSVYSIRILDVSIMVGQNQNKSAT